MLKSFLAILVFALTAPVAVLAQMGAIQGIVTDQSGGLIPGVTVTLTNTETGVVLTAELFNTAAERMCDALHPDRSPAIGTVKDLAAGAVLVFAVMSAAVGGIIFLSDDKIPRIAAFAKGHIALSILIAATLPLAVYLVFRRYTNDNKVSHDNDRRAAERR